MFKKVLVNKKGNQGKTILLTKRSVCCFRYQPGVQISQQQLTAKAKWKMTSLEINSPDWRSNMNLETSYFLYCFISLITPSASESTSLFFPKILQIPSSQDPLSTCARFPHQIVTKLNVWYWRQTQFEANWNSYLHHYGVIDKIIWVFLFSLHIINSICSSYIPYLIWSSSQANQVRMEFCNIREKIILLCYCLNKYD